MDKDILKGLKFGFGIFLFFSIFLGVVWAVGFHSADEILNGTFLGNYTFTGNVDFSSANIIGGGADSMFSGWPDVLICTDDTTTRLFYLSLAPSSDNTMLYRVLMNTAGDYYLKFSMNGEYSSGGGGVTGFDCYQQSISSLYSQGKALNLLSGLSSTPSGAVMSFNLNTCPTGWKACDGTDGTVDLRGQFIRGLNNFGTGVRLDGLEDPELRSLGDFENNSLGNHTHYIFDKTVSTTTITQNQTASYSRAVSTQSGNYLIMGTDNEANLGISSYTGGTETRPNNVALIYCQKE